MSTPSEHFADELLAISKSISTSPAVWLAVGRYLYKLMTEPTPLVNDPTDVHYQDRMRYDRMCGLYQSLLIVPGTFTVPIFPLEWRLNATGCPSHTSRLFSDREEFQRHIDELRASDYPMRNITIKLIASIERLFISIGKRKRAAHLLPYKVYRNDGYEAMFFSDLVHWLSVDLPRYDVTLKSTADMVMRRIKYCKKVQETVFVFRDDKDIHNPKERLDRIMANLETLHKDICKTIEAASFNNHIESLSRDLLYMAIAGFDILHLILKNVNQRELQVDEFLRPTTVDDGVSSLLRTTLGEWIRLTLVTAGITSNDFEGAQLLSMEQVNDHLASIDFTRISIRNTGLPEFAKHDTAFAIASLKQIIEIHQSILNIYHVQTSLIHAARVGVNLGHSWVYGNPEGKLVVKALLVVIEHASNRFRNALSLFWKNFYEGNALTKTGYLPYVRAEGMDDTNTTYKSLILANQRCTNVTVIGLHIIDTKSLIERDSLTFTDDPEATQQKKALLISGLYSCLRHIQGVDATLLSAIGDLAASSSTAPATPAIVPTYTVAAGDIEAYVIRLPKPLTLLYSQAKSGLVDKLEPVSTRDLSLIKRPPRFYTTTQEQIYDRFLVPYHRTISANNVFSIFFGVSWFRIEALREFYIRTRNMITEIYEPHSVRGYTFASLMPDLLLDDKKLYLDIHPKFLNYTLKSDKEEPFKGTIKFSEFDVEFSTTPTLTELRSFYRPIMFIVSRNGHILEDDSQHKLDPHTAEFFEFCKPGTTKQAFLWETELTLIDQCLKQAMHSFSTSFDSGLMAMFTRDADFRLLQVTQRGDHLEVSIDKRFLTFAGGAFAIELESVKGELAIVKMASEAHAEAEKGAKAEAEALRKTVAERDAEITALREQLRIQKAAAQAETSGHTQHPDAFFSSAHVPAAAPPASAPGTATASGPS